MRVPLCPNLGLRRCPAAVARSNERGMERRLRFSLKWLVIFVALVTAMVAIYSRLEQMSQEYGVRFGDTEEIRSGPHNGTVRTRYFKPGPNP
jgi:hypothetical protein